LKVEVISDIYGVAKELRTKWYLNRVFTPARDDGASP
jgi:hypothetical protein